MNWNPKYAILMAFSTLITYISGILIEKSNEKEDKIKSSKEKKLWVFLSFSINLLILFFFKYFNFASDTATYIFSKLHIGIKVPNFNVLLPVGISFYTFQALSYTMDVYRGDTKAQHNLGKYALFVSFFPQLVAGPIERSTHLLKQLDNNYSFDYDRVKNGLLLMLWGFFKKIVIADRLAVLVNTVYNKPTAYKGYPLIVATIFFAFQIYCDFSSYSDIAIGSANVMGYDLMKNFDRPYFSKNIAEFWRRWHISLGTWFRDYLYFPLGGSRVSKLKHYRNIMIVFLVSGLWHGASWNFVIWGGLHGIYQVIGIVLKPFRNYIVEKFKIDRETYGHKLYQTIGTFILVNFAWIFFRANSFRDAKYIVKNLFNISSFELKKLGLNNRELNLCFLMIIFLIIIQMLQKNKILREVLKKENIVCRWIVYFAGILFIIFFGKYGLDVTQDFIYFQF